jgi:hypothetical protein
MVRSFPSPFVPVLLLACALGSAAGCGTGAGSPPGADLTVLIPDQPPGDLPGPDSPGLDAASLDGRTPDAPPAMTVDDGVPSRQACTSNFGSALDTQFGRLDGFLVAIVPPGHRGCNGDSSHLHLQVSVQGSVYDVAVNIGSTPGDVETLERDLPLPDGAWSEGWHPGLHLDYPQLGLRSTDFTPTSSPAALAQHLSDELASVNHISVFATGYGPDGIHDVHYKGSGHDGAIAIRPLSSPAHLLLFHFSDQTF